MKLWATWEVGCFVAMFRSASLADDNRLVLVDHPSKEEALRSQSLSSFRAPCVQLSSEAAAEMLRRIDKLLAGEGTEPGGPSSSAAPRGMTLHLESAGTRELSDLLAPHVEEILRSCFREHA